MINTLTDKQWSAASHRHLAHIAILQSATPNACASTIYGRLRALGWRSPLLANDLYAVSKLFRVVKSMPSNPSRKITVTLPLVEGEEIEQAALAKGVSAPQIIRERLAEWKHPSPLTSTPLVQPDIMMPFLKELIGRLENLEQQSASTQKMLQQILKEDIPDSHGIELPQFLVRMERLEGILDGIHVLVERIAREVTSNPEEEAAVIQEIQTTLEQFLEKNQ